LQDSNPQPHLATASSGCADISEATSYDEDVASCDSVEEEKVIKANSRSDNAD
jgi:hypothetical protein